MSAMDTHKEAPQSHFSINSPGPSLAGLGGVHSESRRSLRQFRGQSALSLTKAIAAATSTDERNSRRCRSRTTSASASHGDSSTSSLVSCDDGSRDEDYSLGTSFSTNADDTMKYTSQKLASATQSSDAERTRRLTRERVMSAPNLHINTLLPLTMPPADLAKRACSASSSPCPPTSHTALSQREQYSRSNHYLNSQDFGGIHDSRQHTSSGPLEFEALDLQRTNSVASMVSVSTDGSWHGDAGDDDPDGQLERALQETHSRAHQSNIKKAETVKTLLEQHESMPVVLETRDFNELSDDWPLHAPRPLNDLLNDVDEDEIQKHAGPLMHTVASLFFGAGAFKNLRGFGLDDDAIFEPTDECPRLRTLRASMSSPSQLAAESSNLRSLACEPATPRPLTSRPSGTVGAILNKMWDAVLPSQD